MIKISRRLLVRNTLFNLLGQVAPLLISVFTLPPVLRLLGTERYGILTLATLILGYFNVFELGIGGAVTKFVAESLGRGHRHELPELIWTAFFSQCLLGAVGGGILFFMTPWLVDKFFNIPAGMIHESRIALYLLSAAIPVMLASSSMSGVLEAGQRFDLANAVAIPTGAASSLLSYVGARAGFNLPGIIVLLLCLRTFVLVVYIGMDIVLFPELRASFRYSMNALRVLVGFGTWLSLIGLIVPFLLYMDRFLLGRYLTMTDVTYYSIPFEAMTRLWIIPRSLVRVLFPAFSTLNSGNPEDTNRLYIASLRFMFLFSVPVLIGVCAFVPNIFGIWLGASVAPHCTPILQILVFGAVFSMLAPLAGSLLQGLGRPDLLFKVYLISLPFNVIAVWLLVRYGGLSGAAYSYVLRAAVETFVLLWISLRVIRIDFATLRHHNAGGAAAAFIFAIGAMAVVNHIGGTALRASVASIAVVLFIAIAWCYMLDIKDKEFLRSQIALDLAAIK